MTPISITVVCTGNAARSVMAAAMLARLKAAPQLTVRSAGTLAVEGRPMGLRTLKALEALQIDPPEHLSHQLTDADLVEADLVIALAGEHVRYIRRRHPDASPRTATLRRLCRDLSAGGEPLSTRIAGLRLDEIVLEEWEDVADPAVGDDSDYLTCAADIRDLVLHLAPRLG